MWSGNEECNEEGEPVRLYQPIQYGRTGVEPDDLTASYIGGPLHPHRRCPLCQESLVSVVQLHVAQANRTLRLWACNRSSCWRTLVATSKLHVGGGRGIVVAEGLEVPAETVTATAPKPKSIVPRVATADTTADDWGDVGGDASGLEDLEAKLASMETKKTPSKKSVTKATTGTTQLPLTAAAGTSPFSLPLLSLYSTQEPPSRTTAVDARDVGLHGTSHRQIQDMLNRYLAAEDDTNLVQMLRGKTGADTGGSQETDQDLTAADFALLQFSDRIKRAPRQVLRYARGGEPLWSIPTPTLTASPKKGNRPSSSHHEFAVPPCTCGAPRTFECQVLPSILHVLQVDKHARPSRATNGNPQQLNDWYAAGGMDFGSVAIYTCSKDCQQCPEDVVVVQDTAEDQPKVPAATVRDAEDIVVDENATGDTADEDGFEADGMEE